MVHLGVKDSLVHSLVLPKHLCHFFNVGRFTVFYLAFLSTLTNTIHCDNDDDDIMTVINVDVSKACRISNQF